MKKSDINTTSSLSKIEEEFLFGEGVSEDSATTKKRVVALIKGYVAKGMPVKDIISRLRASRSAQAVFGSKINSGIPRNQWYYYNASGIAKLLREFGLEDEALYITSQADVEDQEARDKRMVRNAVSDAHAYAMDHPIKQLFMNRDKFINNSIEQQRAKYRAQQDRANIAAAHKKYGKEMESAKAQPNLALFGEGPMPAELQDRISKMQEAPKKPSFVDVDDETDDGEYYDDGEGGEEMPDEFLFESKMIFLSNLKDIPPAVGDRCITIGLHYTKDQALDLIEHKLDSLCPEYPELSLAMKKKIVNFMRKHQSQAKRFSFRSFLHIATIYMSGDPNWEQWALIQMRSMPV